MGRIKNWVYFHKTAKYRIARLGKLVDYWMGEAIRLDNLISEPITPTYVEAGGILHSTLPNSEGELGEFPPFDGDCRGYLTVEDGPVEDGTITPIDRPLHEGPGL